MEWERQKAYEYQKGKQEAKLEDARNLYANGVFIDIIAKSLNMSIDEIEQVLSETV